MSQLFHYQIPSFRRLVNAIGLHRVALDASDTGTGKTPKSCAACKELGLRPAVVCPKNLIPVWMKTCRDWGLPDPVFVLNYEALRGGKTGFLVFVQQGRRKYAQWNVPAGTLLIFDEVHRCAGYATLNSKMLVATRRYGIPVLCLSATAAESPLKLWALGYVLGLHNGGDSFWKFATEHGCVRNRWDGVEFPVGVARPGSRRAIQVENARHRLCSLHRNVFEGDGETPKGVRVRIADLGDAFPETLVTADAYEFRLRDLTANFTNSANDNDNQLVVAMRERQALELLKAPGLAEMAQDGVEDGSSVIIFVNFTATLDALRKLIKGLPVIDGRTPIVERADILEKFGADEIRIVAANLAAAGEGLDGLQDLRGEYPRLTLISPGFNAVQLKQALGRVHRANSKSKSVQRIVFAAGTVEERACKAVRAKLANIALLNDGDLVGEG